MYSNHEKEQIASWFKTDEKEYLSLITNEIKVNGSLSALNVFTRTCYTDYVQEPTLAYIMLKTYQHYAKVYVRKQIAWAIFKRIYGIEYLNKNNEVKPKVKYMTKKEIYAENTPKKYYATENPDVVAIYIPVVKYYDKSKKKFVKTPQNVEKTKE